MRIGVDATALYGCYGGVEYSLWNLLCALHAERSDNEYSVFIPGDGPPLEHLRAFNSRWRWIRLPFRGEEKLRRIFWQQCVLPGQLLRERCDVLHAPTYVAPLNTPVPVALTVYDLIAIAQPQFATPLNRRHYGLMLPQSISRATRIVVPSEKVKNEIAARFPDASERTHVISLGVEPIFFQEQSPAISDEVRVRYDLPEKYLLFVGNFEPKKNLGNVLRALESIPDAPPLVVAGGMRAWPQCEMKSNGLVRTIGYVARRDLPALYGQCEAFLFPSLAEGFGLPVLEALACGAPVITSEAVPLPGLENAALLCDADQPDSIAAALQSLLGNVDERARLAKAGRDYARPFTWRRAAKQTLEVYRETAAVQR